MSSFGDSDETMIVDERPTKRQRVDLALPTRRQLFLEEIDLEIALRERLSRTVQSRITWALLLQEHTSRALSGHGSGDTTFRDASLNALESLEDPCHILFNRSVRPIERLDPVVITPEVGTPTSTSAPPPLPVSRTRGINRTVRAPPKRLLFLRNNAIHPAQIVKLACPDCARTDFSNLQGLLNHCRLRHHREFGSHDECVQSCAVLVEGDDQQAWVAANGTEVAGISLPGLRRLFEIAVGGSHAVHAVLPTVAPPAAVQPPDGLVAAGSTNGTSVAENTQQTLLTSLLTRTLGLHEDSPALAPFLGRTPKQRLINVYETDGDIDLFSQVDGRTRPTGRWRPRYAGRSQAVDDHTLDDVQDIPHSPVILRSEVNENSSPRRSTLHGTGSRFHILGRVTVEDQSFWIPPDKRLKSTPQHTHRWRLSVSSPSYSLPLISFLDKITIICLTDPPPSTLLQPLIVDGPPFVITSTTDRPFLASLEFSWTAPDRNAPITVEHWVELDPLHLNTPVSGDQQVFDVELDRDTELLAARDDPEAVSWDFFIPSDDKSVGYEGSASRGTVENPDPQFEKHQNAHQKHSSPGHERLHKLVSQVPLTLKDVKGRLVRDMPYHMAATPMHFLNLVHGRRKAVEWARARTLRDAYEKACAEDVNRTPDGPTCATLSTADVYHWLESQGYLPRPVKTKISPARQRSSGPSVEREPLSTRSGLYCHRCGLSKEYHPDHQANSASSLFVKKEARSVSVAAVSAPTPCTVFIAEPSPIPIVDVGELMSSTPPRLTVDSHSHLDWSPDTILAVSEPSIVSAVQDLLRNWNLSCFGGTAMSLGSSGSTKSEIEGALAPAAILSLLARSMAKWLLRGAVEVYRQDESSQRKLVRYKGSAGQSKDKNQAARRLLTPSHIMRMVAPDYTHGSEHYRVIAATVIGMLGAETISDLS